MTETDINIETKSDDLSRKISGLLADGTPTIVKLPNIEQEHLLSDSFNRLFGDVEVIQILNLEKNPEEVLKQMVELNLLEHDSFDGELDDVATYTPVDIRFGNISPDIVTQVRRQHYFITGLASFATSTKTVVDIESGEIKGQDGRDKFSVALGVRQAMKTARAFSIILAGEKTTSDYYHQNVILKRIVDELIPPPPETEVIMY